MTTEAQATEAQATEAQATLSIQDLANLKAIIDVASQRGAFRPEEFTVVGTTYSKLAAFIQSVTPAAPETETTGEQA